MLNSEQNLFPEHLQDLIEETAKNAEHFSNLPTIQDSHLIYTLLKEHSGSFNDLTVFLKMNKIDISVAMEAAEDFMNSNIGSYRATFAKTLSNPIVLILNSSASATVELGLNESSKLLVFLSCISISESLHNQSSLDTSGYELIQYINVKLGMNGNEMLTSELYEKYKDKIESDSDQALDNTPQEGSIFERLSEESKEDDRKEEDGDEVKSSEKKKKKATPALDNFTINLSLKAEEGNLDPIVGREVEVERTVQILSRKKKNNPVLVGEPGVGKTAIVEGLALRIASGEVPSNMLDRKVLSLDLTSLVAGTKYRGDFEERMKMIMSEINDNPEVILFIDEIHTIVGAGNSSGAMDAANILKPALARGEMQCIGATTFKEYRESIEKDGALERRFQKIKVDPATEEEAMEILSRLRESYGDHHGVVYSEEAIKACVDFSVKYINDRHLPDKAIDIMDEVGSKLKLKLLKDGSVNGPIKKFNDQIAETEALREEAAARKDYSTASKLKDSVALLKERKEKTQEAIKKYNDSNRPEVSVEDVALVISSMTGIPVAKLDSDEITKMKMLETNIKANLIGQDKAVEEISKAIKRNRLGFDEGNKPIGTFLFKGPTGVGKTQLAKELAKEIFNSEDALIRIDMSEFSHKHEVSRLIGSAPGFVGYEEGGKLTEAVRNKPYSIVLLDEIEKAHKDVFNVFLQVFDDGRLTDGQGRTVNFSNTIIIMTSNVGSRSAQNEKGSIGFGGSSEASIEAKKATILDSELKQTFSPEFLNRLDGVIGFNYLTKENIEEILDLDLKKLTSKYKKNNYAVKFDKKSKEFLVKQGFKKEFGARPLKRALKTYVDDLMVDSILDGTISEGSNLTITYKEGDEKLKVKTALKTKKKEVVEA